MEKAFSVITNLRVDLRLKLYWPAFTGLGQHLGYLNLFHRQYSLQPVPLLRILTSAAAGRSYLAGYAICAGKSTNVARFIIHKTLNKIRTNLHHLQSFL